MPEKFFYTFLIASVFFFSCFFISENKPMEEDFFWWSAVSTLGATVISSICWIWS